MTTIERKLGDPDITPARIAQIEGISERYLQKLFEGSGDNFTHYLRERRLQRCWADLGNASEAHRSVSDIAFGCGFSDAAHFSRSFRDRFGLSPRAFRQQQAERLSGLGVSGRAARLAAGCDRATASASGRADDRSGRAGTGRPYATAAGQARASSSADRCEPCALGIFQPRI